MGKSPQRKSRKAPCLITRTWSTQQERRDPCVDQNPHKVACVTCSCERSRKLPCSRTRWRRSKVILIEEHFMPTCSRKNVYNPFSTNSKAMIRELDNVELFELCETVPKVQCSQCLLCWNQGVIYCTCGQFLIDSESTRKFNKLRLDALSIPKYVIKKGRSHGARHGKNWRTKRVTYGLECVEEMLQESWLSRWTFHRYSRSILRDPVHRESQLAIGWTEQKCKELDDHTYRLTLEEKRRYNGQWYLTLNKEGKICLWSFDLITEPLS